MPKVNCKLIHTRKYSINYACISFSLFVAYIRIIISKWRNKNISENNLYETVRTSKQMRRKKERKKKKKKKRKVGDNDNGDEQQKSNTK